MKKRKEKRKYVARQGIFGIALENIFLIVLENIFVIVLETIFVIALENNIKGLDPSYMIDLDLWKCSEEENTLTAELHKTGIQI